MGRWIALAVLASLGAACGRIGFDPSERMVDAGTLGDGSVPTVDALTACNVAAPSLVDDSCATAAAATVSTSLLDVTAGNLLVVAVNYDSATANATVTDTAGNALMTGQIVRSATSTLVVFSTISATSGFDTVTVTLDGPVTFTAVFAHELTGLDASGTSTSAIGTGTTATTPSLSTTAANELLFGHAVSDDIVMSVGAGFSTIQSCAGDMTAYRVVATPGAYAATYTISSAVNWLTTLTAFKACI